MYTSNVLYIFKFILLLHVEDKEHNPCGWPDNNMNWVWNQLKKMRRNVCARNVAPQPGRHKEALGHKGSNCPFEIVYVRDNEDESE